MFLFDILIHQFLMVNLFLSFSLLQFQVTRIRAMPAGVCRRWAQTVLIPAMTTTVRHKCVFFSSSFNSICISFAVAAAAAATACRHINDISNSFCFLFVARETSRACNVNPRDSPPAAAARFVKAQKFYKY